MHTTFTFRTAVPQDGISLAELLAEQAHALVDKLESELSEFLPASPVYVLNASAQSQPVKVPSSVIALLKMSLQVSDETGGAFDACIKSSTPTRPLFAWDETESTVWKLHSGAVLSFGAIGKGYALDQVRCLFESEGVCNYILSAGGSSVILSGEAAPNTPWQWGWAWKYGQSNEPLGVQLFHRSNEAVALGVSGEMDQPGHILSNQPNHAAPPQSALCAARTAAQADALSTALYVSGWDRFYEEKTTDFCPISALINSDGRAQFTRRFESLWGKLAAGIALISCQLSKAASEVDLSELGFDDFAPYTIDRDPLWMLLPAAALGLVLLHLRRGPARLTRMERLPE